jgi:hypothetical protein
MIRNPKTAPDQVLQVHDIMMRNAIKKWGAPNVFGRAPLYVSAEKTYNSQSAEYEDTKNWVVWVVSVNFGTFPTLVFKSGSWFYRLNATGQDVKMTGGHAEALKNARLSFTG